MITTQKVIDYLKANPMFLIENEEILSLLDIDVDAPFHERQLAVLKKRDEKQKEKMNFILESAHQNQKLETHLLTVATRLLVARGETEPLAFVAQIIEQQFNIERVLLLTPPNSGAEQCAEQYEQLQQRVKHKSSVCDDRVSSELLKSLFGKEHQQIASCAFLPLLHENKLIGVGVLGANDKQRFLPKNGVIYLDKLGLIIGGYLTGIKR